MIEALLVVVLAASWLTILARLVLDLTGLRRLGAYDRWPGTALLLINGVVLTTLFAELRGWPNSRLGILRLILLPIMLAGLALLGFSIRVRAKTRRGDAAVGTSIRQEPLDDGLAHRPGPMGE
jgi:hypothetical protein